MIDVCLTNVKHMRNRVTAHQLVCHAYLAQGLSPEIPILPRANPFLPSAIASTFNLPTDAID